MGGKKMTPEYEYTQTRYVGPFERIKDSIKGVFVGIILFCLAFPLIFWGERRTNIGEVVEKAQEVDLSTPQTGLDGKPIRGMGTMEAQTPALDTEFLATGKFLFLQRIPEIFSWEEKKETKKEKEGNKEVEKITYKYEKKWVTEPQDSSKFKRPQTPSNGKLSLTKKEVYAENVSVGKFKVDPTRIDLHYGVSDITFSNEQWVPGDGRYPSGRYLYSRNGADTNSLIGDERIGYRGWPLPDGGQKVTVAGSISGDQLGAMVYDESEKLFILFPGTSQELVARLKTEHSMTTWIIRIVGFFFIWGGMSLMIGPFTTMLEFIPLLGSFGSGLIHMFLGALALFLAVVTIIFAKMFIVVLLIAAMVIGGLIFAVFKGIAASNAKAIGGGAAAFATQSPPPPPPPPPPPAS